MCVKEEEPAATPFFSRPCQAAGGVVRAPFSLAPDERLDVASWFVATARRCETNRGGVNTMWTITIELLCELINQMD